MLELWGGPECTVNRIGERYRDQMALTGHEHRLDDLARFAALGVRRLRYPVLWERVAPDRAGEHDWRWTDARLESIAREGMTPIVGLLHHGSGPRRTSLIDDDFPVHFGAYAGAVARRYAQVEDWTPVNEPLTTARFSALYGVWYPHARDEGLFWRALLNQVDGTRAAMAAIRAVNADARLIQTEDMAHHYATAPLAEVAAHFNDRRWATWDLLTGRLTPDHPLWPRIAGFGLGDRLRAIADDPCPPDVIGVNYYPTSERFLDHRLDRYPMASAESGYHDVTAARVLTPPPMGLDGLMRQVWDRYRLPIAVTESHLGCTRDEQLRWLWQAWRTCQRLRDEGVDVRALTAWALLGNVDWDSLIANDAGHYEPGPFDVSGEQPRATAIAALLGTLGRGEPPPARLAPILATPGWWERDIRLEHPPTIWAAPAAPLPRARLTRDARPLLICGATGTLGRALAAACRLRGLPFLLTDRATLPIDQPARVAAYLDAHKPWAVINAAGWVRVDDAEGEADACLRANGEAAIGLARACAARDVHCTLFSSDLVFDGTAGRSYVEDDAVRPLNVYGRSKAVAETALATCPDALLVRTAAFFSPDDEHNFAVAVERALRRGEGFAASAAHVVTPTYVPDLVRATLDLIVDGEAGIWHLTNEEPLSWHDFAGRLAAALGLDPSPLAAATPAALGWRAARPANAALRSTRGLLLPSFADALARHARAREAVRAQAGVARAAVA